MVSIRTGQVIMLATALVALTACEHRAPPGRATPPDTLGDTMGVTPAAVRTIDIRGHADLVENSAAAMSTRQPGIWFTVNDSGHEPVLFALDTMGTARGRWLVRGARNIDWESAAYGPCGNASLSTAADSSGRCVYIGDTGDNDATAASRSIYRMREPAAREPGRRDNLAGSIVPAARLTYRYADGPHDVEAMYVAPDAAIYLITKRPFGSRTERRFGRALVFRLAAARWSARAVQTAELVDSLPIVLGSAFARYVTDAALSPDAKYLAVRTYTQVYVFATDSTTGRLLSTVAPAVCNIASLQEPQGEGITWMADARRLLLTTEGRGASFHILTCPLPQ